MVMQKLKEDGRKKRMFNDIKRLMRKQEQKHTSIKISNGSGITVNDEQEVVNKWRYSGAIRFAHMGK